MSLTAPYLKALLSRTQLVLGISGFLRASITLFTKLA